MAYATKICMKLLLSTCRIEVEGLDRFISAAQNSSCILMLWHNRLIALAWFLNRYAPDFVYHAFVSKSRDGEAVARLAESYPAGRVIRVAHNARHRALNKMVECLKNGHAVILITPDGPRGPRYKVKPGVVFAAKESGVPIIPFSWQADKVWQLQTWDQMMIPKPFCKIKVSFGTPIAFEKEEGQNHEESAEQLRNALHKLEKDKGY